MIILDVDPKVRVSHDSLITRHNRSQAWRAVAACPQAGGHR